MARPPHKRNHDLLLAALARFPSQEKAAQQAGLSRSTAQRHLADPEFQRQLEAFRAELVQQRSSALTASGAACRKLQRTAFADVECEAPVAALRHTVPEQTMRRSH